MTSYSAHQTFSMPAATGTKAWSRVERTAIALNDQPRGY
jgi:hypothetical protein